MSSAKSNIEPYYDGAHDIFYYFRDKKSTGTFLKFMFLEAIEFSKKIEENGNQKPFPIQYNSKMYSYQMDYNYFIFVLGSWVAKKTGDKAKLKRVLRDFAITKYAINNSPNRETNEESCQEVGNITATKNRQILSIFLGETLTLFVNRNTAKDKKPWTQLEKNDITGINYYPVFNPSIYEHNGSYFDFKIITMRQHQMRFFVDDWKEFMEDNEHWFFQDSSEQVAFSSGVVKKYWSRLLQEDGVKKRFYFSVFDEDFFNDMGDILERNTKA
jgi:hypothetical protein